MMVSPSMREKSFGQDYRNTLVDQLGIWLSFRQVKRWVKSFEGMVVADIGCGYHARLSRHVLRQGAKQVLVSDVSLSGSLKELDRICAIEGDLVECVKDADQNSFDVVFCISVLEHLWNYDEVMEHLYRMIRPGGILLVNVPSWRGKFFLEFSAFRLGFSPPHEMDDHKIYFDVKDLWPMLVRAGFRPSKINCYRHKFGLNTFAACRK
jgi:2-polyprenyl-3-methyl-5-hydroxy-6-metoxy-1,4-benzoquinol methylase